MTGPSVSRCCAYGKTLRAHIDEPAVGQLDLSDRHRARVGQVEQQRVAVRRIARYADGIGHQLIGHRGDGTFEDLGEPIVGMQLLPDRGRGQLSRETVHDDELLADP